MKQNEACFQRRFVMKLNVSATYSMLILQVWSGRSVGEAFSLDFWQLAWG